MLQVSEIKRLKEKYVKGLNKRGISNAEALLDEVLELDESRKKIQTENDNILAERNQASKSIGGLLKEGKKEEAEAVKTTVAQLKEKGKALETKLKEVEHALQTKLYNIPNIPNDDVVAGHKAEDNEIIFTSKDILEVEDGKPHWDLIKEYNIVDFELGNKISGAGFPVYKGQGARLQRALINFFIDRAAEAGYHEVQPPILINEASGYGTGQLPDKEGQMYMATEDQLYLIPTAEVPITNLYRDVIVEERELPIKMVGHTPCFRREAGSWGAHVRGLNRLHQFDKVEIVQIQSPENSYEALKGMIDHVEGLIKSLELPYRILRLCGGDMGFTAAITYDFEVYSAAQKQWLEVSSVSNFETYQASRLMLRGKGSDKTKRLLHTLNGSALALPRIVAALLENNQGKDGITMPSALRSYLSFDKIVKR